MARDFVQQEVAAIRAADPQRRPVAINHGEHFVFDDRWQWTLADADIVATSIYPFRNYEVAGIHFVVPILELGPITPNYAARARETQGQQAVLDHRAPGGALGGRRHSQRDAGVAGDDNMTPENFRKNVDYARRTGATRVCLPGRRVVAAPGAEYGDGTWMNWSRRRSR